MSSRLGTSIHAVLACSLALQLVNASAPAQAQLIINETYKLLAGDGAVDDRFGSSVAISGDTAMTGRYGEG